MKRAITILSALVLAACGESGLNNPDVPDVGGEVSETSTCITISGGETKVATVTTACPSCESSNPQNAHDGDISTYGALTSSSVTAGFVGYRAIAQEGIVFPAASQAGAIAAITRNTHVESGSIVLRTYLGGTQQEETAFSTTAATVNGVSNGQARLYSFETSEPFDSVAFGLSGSANNLDIKYFEFCSDN